MWSLILKIIGWLFPVFFHGNQKRDDEVNLGKFQNENEHLQNNLEAQKAEIIALQNRPVDDDAFAASLRHKARSDKSDPG